MPNQPVTLVILGASGDLTHRLLLPGLGTLLRAKPDYAVSLVGAAFDDLDEEAWRGRVREALGEGGCRDEQAERMAAIAKALGDPIRLQLVDVLRKHAGKVCVCELVPLFDISQPTLSHHLKKLREAGIVDSERRGLWAYYYVLPDALQELTAWLS